jgi:microcystin-dependent protein
MADNYLGQVTVYGFGYAPRTWMICQGQLLPVNQNQALFSLLGTNYGGNGQTNFQLPDLRSRVGISVGVDPAGNQYSLGQVGGTETVTINMQTMPPGPHTHSVQAQNLVGTTNVPAGNLILAKAVQGTTANPANIYNSTAPNSTMMAPQAIGSVGGQPHANIMPVQALNYCIALQGVYPTRG